MNPYGVRVQFAVRCEPLLRLMPSLRLWLLPLTRKPDGRVFPLGRKLPMPLMKHRRPAPERGSWRSASRFSQCVLP